MCGLVGYNGSVPASDLVLRILGSANDSRGGDSCGISSDFEIKKGTGLNSKFSSFIEEEGELFTNKVSNNVIIHTRKATVGAHTKENAHPFGFHYRGHEDETYFIGAHNGSLVDWRDLISKEYRNSFTVDSKALLFRIFVDRNTNVLKEYKGAAALLFYSRQDPSVLYAWKGAAGGVEERPLYYIQTRDEETGKINGVYLSSMPEPFLFMGISKKHINEVPKNTLLTFRDGKIVGKKVIDRPLELGPASRNNNQRHLPFRSGNYDFAYDDATDHTSSLIKNRRHNIIPRSKERPPAIYARTEKASKFYQFVPGNNVFFYYNRYWRNNRLLHGLYVTDMAGKIMYTCDNLERFCSVVIEQFNNNSEFIPLMAVNGICAKDKESYIKLKAYINSAHNPTGYNMCEFTDYPMTTVTGDKITDVTVADYFFYKEDVIGDAKFILNKLSPFLIGINKSKDVVSIEVRSNETPFIRELIQNLVSIVSASDEEKAKDPSRVANAEKCLEMFDDHVPAAFKAKRAKVIENEINSKIGEEIAKGERKTDESYIKIIKELESSEPSKVKVNEIDLDLAYEAIMNLIDKSMDFKYALGNNSDVEAARLENKAKELFSKVLSIAKIYDITSTEIDALDVYFSK